MSVASHSSPVLPTARSAFTSSSTVRDFDSIIAGDFTDDPNSLEGEHQEESVYFCLLAEFDIDAGATLAHQYPYPTGTDEHRLAELMLPDGAHLRAEDWTVFYLGQTASSAVAPLLSHEAEVRASMESDRRASMMQHSGEKPRQGVAGGGLLYVLNCVRMKEDKKMRRGAMVKAMAICTPCPYIGIYKPLLLLALEEYFASPSSEVLARLYDSANAMSRRGMPILSHQERILLRGTERKDMFEEKYAVDLASGTKEVFDDASSVGHTEEETSVMSHRRGPSSAQSQTSSGGRPPAMRKGSSSSSQMYLATPPSREGRLTPDLHGEGKRRKGVPRDTHFFETEARFGKITVPIRVPMTVFDEDVGDYSLIELVQTFSTPHTFPAPYQPYLHTNGSNTHPVILILNTLLAHKRVMFLGYGLPANQVARMVLAACALVSGCGQILRGVTKTAFPYANLASLDILEEFSGFVVGVTNPRFEQLPHTWDVLCNLESGKVTVSKNLGTGHIRNTSDASVAASTIRVEEDNMTSTPSSKSQANARADCVDNQFMDDILAGIASHYGEAHIRIRFIDYLNRFVRLAAYQEYMHTGSTKIGFPTSTFRDGILGTGAVFVDDQAKQREMLANGHRIDAWRKTKSYRTYVQDWDKAVRRRAIRDFDVQHQVARLRTARIMSDAEVEAIFLALADGVRTYDQVVELLTHLPAHWGGIIPIANGLFHRSLRIRENTMEVLTTMQLYPVGRQAVMNMNYFHRKTYLQLLEQRDTIITHQREREDRMRDFERDQAERGGSGYSELASLGTVHGSEGGRSESLAATPQGVGRV